MNLELMYSLIILGGLLFLILMGVEVAVAMGIVAGLGLLLFAGQNLKQFAFSSFEVMNSFALTSAPLFILMGTLFSRTGVTNKLFDGAKKLLGNFPGGLACSVMGANALFGAMSGSTMAAAATFGTIALPDMERLGYDPKLALGSIAVGGSLAALIPPSVIMIIYCELQTVSLPRLFAAGVMPGILLALLLTLTVVVQVKLNPRLAPRAPKSIWREKLIALGEVAPFLAVILAVLGVIFMGIMTPTESAALGVFLSVVLALAYRRMSLSALKESMRTVVKITAMLAFLLVTSRVLTQLLQYVGITKMFSTFMLGLPFGKYGIFAVICAIYLILGMFFDAISMLVLTLPFVGPLVLQLGFSSLWFGVVYVVLCEIGVVTPPFGLNLFVLHGVAPKHSILTIARGSLPFMIPMLLLIVILTAFPKLALWFPSVLY